MHVVRRDQVNRVRNDNDNDVYFYSAISTKKPIALYSINNNSKPLNIYKLKINETKYKFKYTLNAKKKKLKKHIHSP